MLTRASVQSPHAPFELHTSVVSCHYHSAAACQHQLPPATGPPAHVSTLPYQAPSIFMSLIVDKVEQSIRGARDHGICVGYTYGLLLGFRHLRAGSGEILMDETLRSTILLDLSIVSHQEALA